MGVGSDWRSTRRFECSLSHMCLLGGAERARKEACQPECQSLTSVKSVARASITRLQDCVGHFRLSDWEWFISEGYPEL